MKHSLKVGLGLLLVLAITFSAGYFAGHRQPTSVVVAQEDGSDTEELFVPFWEAWQLLHENYVFELDDNALMEAALSGMVNSLGDTHMGYTSPTDYQEILDSLNGEFEGIGATVRQDEETGALTIVRPLPDSPAEGAGILAGDQIVTVDGEDITGLDESVVISKVRGPAGTDVVLGIRREGQEELLEITVTRDKIVLPSVAHEVFEGNIGYLQLFQFSPDTAAQTLEALEDMDADNLNGLIIDLRGNGGGYVDVTLEIISYFIPDGTLLIERGSNGEELIHEATGNIVAPNVPIVVLVDGSSASASEFMAGALQDRGRATIVGVATFGKGSVQTWRQLTNGGGVRITIAKWFTPSGYSVEPDGIQPDVVVEFPELEPGTPYSQDIDTQLQAAIDALLEKTTPRA